MCLDYDKDWLMRYEQMADQIRLAARERLAQQVRSQRPRAEHPFRRALAWLGQILVALGGRLQQRAGLPVEALAAHNGRQATCPAGLPGTLEPARGQR
jgi:hypothetical protein